MRGPHLSRLFNERVDVLIDVQGAFPVRIALWPSLPAATVIVAGRSGSRFGLDRVLTSRSRCGSETWPARPASSIGPLRASPPFDRPRASPRDDAAAG